MTIEKFLALEPGVAPGVTPEFLANRAKVMERAHETAPENTLSRDVVAQADEDSDRDEQE